MNTPTNRTIPGLENLLTLSNSLVGPTMKLTRDLLAREISNHMFVKASSPNSSAELTEQDVTIILLRMGLVFQTTQQSERGHESYAQSHHRNGGLDAVDRALNVSGERQQGG